MRAHDTINSQSSVNCTLYIQTDGERRDGSFNITLISESGAGRGRGCALATYTCACIHTQICINKILSLAGWRTGCMNCKHTLRLRVYTEQMLANGGGQQRCPIGGYISCVYIMYVCVRVRERASEREIEDYTGAMFQAEVPVRAAASTWGPGGCYSRSLWLRPIFFSSTQAGSRFLHGALIRISLQLCASRSLLMDYFAAGALLQWAVAEFVRRNWISALHSTSLPEIKWAHQI